MKVQLEKSFSLPGSADVAWRLLQDIEAVAGCMPGASITERVDDTHYKGAVAVRLGPANLAFRGQVEVLALESERRLLRMVGKGTDSSGASGASMDLTARIEPVDASSCQLVGTSQVTMSGKAATFGARMMTPVSEHVLGQFAANFAARVQAMQAEVASAPSTPADPAVDPDPPAKNPPPPPSLPPAAPLSGFALAWAVLRDWLRSLFGAGRA